MPRPEAGGEVTAADLMCVCIARQVVDGEVLAQGLATPLVAAGYLLAWKTHAPNVSFASAIGQSLCQDGAPLGLATIESLWLDRSLVTYGFVSAAVDMLPRVRPKEFFRPGQVDAAGNFNNIALGSRLPPPAHEAPRNGRDPGCDTGLERHLSLCATPFADHVCRAARFSFGTRTRRAQATRARAALPGLRPGTIRL